MRLLTRCSKTQGADAFSLAGRTLPVARADLTSQLFKALSQTSCAESLPAEWIIGADVVGSICVLNSAQVALNFLKPVSYTHLTLPTILLVQISVVAVSLKKKNKTNT
eukprot:TRINITY_DN4945_c0_g1_i1.p4 TRINITY_DN4945_c0_g1~~TRINITY_DN4945_c0_g1_i1.p4  ORF type:complete len:108 (+),score=21.04 TRINITY_DN4945_c0_g1_i1:316-639(+)